MATIRKRARKDGTEFFQVRWLEGGRGGSWQNEKFADPTSAETFKKLVDAHGQRWPYGWVPGEGFVEPEQEPDETPLLDWARRYVRRLTGIDERTRADYFREVERHLSLIVHTLHTGKTMTATIENLTADDVHDWVRLQEAGERAPGSGTTWLRRPAAPKSIANRHGLLWCIVQAAVDGEPALRTKNCCSRTRLPRTDNEITEDMVFLEQEEYQRIRHHITDANARDLADWLVGTGMRWSEATALQMRDLKLAGPNPTANVQRAWKRAPKGADRSFFLGPPKTQKARRIVARLGTHTSGDGSPSHDRHAITCVRVPNCPRKPLDARELLQAQVEACRCKCRNGRTPSPASHPRPPAHSRRMAYRSQHPTPGHPGTSWTRVHPDNR